MYNRATHTTSTAIRRAKATLAIIGAALLIAVLGASAADAMTIQVVNDHGIPQAGVPIRSSTGAPLANTDGGGNAVVSVAAGETVYVSRYIEGDPASPCNAVPEGSPGVAYSVPSPPPAQATVTVPSSSNLSNPAYEPGLSGSERKLVGQINDLRRSLGLAPLQISTVLSEVADRYLSQVLTHPYDPSNPDTFHCISGSPTLRAVDAGFPGFAGENGGFGCPASAVYESWYAEKGTASDGHYENMISTIYQAIGLAYENGTWVVDFGVLFPGFESRAGLTGDYGDSGVADSNLCATPTGGGGDTTTPKTRVTRRTPKVEVSHVQIHGHHVSFLITLPKAAAAGPVRVVAKSGHSTRGLRVHGSKTTRHVTANIKEAGVWKVKIVFMPHDQKDWRRGRAKAHFKIS